MQRAIVILAAAALVGLALAAGPALAQTGTPNLAKPKAFRLTRAMTKQARACLECHRVETPGIFGDWARSRHANANITCLDCHQAESHDKDVSQSHFEHYKKGTSKWATAEYRVPVAAAVTPKDCSRCHPDEAKQYGKSKHANTLEIIWKIDPWLNAGLNTDFERATGCLKCHGTVLTMKQGKLDPATWPNTGVGRLNFDGSKGSCTSCHTRHAFSVAEARKPEACGQCHLGPDHPQIEIYKESKHGAIYDAFGDKWNWTSAPGTWTPGVDYRAPTCATCHISGVGSVRTSHDVTERLAWEIQAPVTVRPSQFKPFPAKTNHEVERKKMKAVCMQCHGKTWTDGHFAQFDQVVKLYNDTYFKPAQKKLGELYAKGLLPKKAFFRSPLWVEYYELWHHEGRRARMGAAMMAPDYAWWHGFYECKKRYASFMQHANKLIKENKKGYVAPVWPGSGGNTTRPVQIFGPKK